MAKTRALDSSAPKSRLDRISRDLNRSLLHGSRVETSTGTFRPATVVTGQQIPVNVPASGGLTCSFNASSTAEEVVVARADALSSDAAMRGALRNPDKYLRLQIDREIPTWVFHQREFTLPDRRVPEHVAELSAQQLVVHRLSEGVLQEIQTIGEACDVTLLEMEPATFAETPVSTWRPAILVRFPLQAFDANIFELTGTPQGDRYYLDRLSLLPGDPSGAVQIESMALLLQNKNSALTPVPAWTLARTNLTQEARPGTLLRAATDATFPFVATEAEPEETLRLLQMASITNSGGYFLKPSAPSNADMLVVCVLLKATRGVESSVSVPLAANAVAYAVGLTPEVARIEGHRSVQVTPFVPPGHISFGWTRTEPTIKQGDEEQFGFGTISLVDYKAIDAAGRRVEDDSSNIAISPLQPLNGDHIRAASVRALTADGPADPPANSAAIRLVPQGSPYRVSVAHTDGQETRRYRASLRCYRRRESPYAALADPNRRAITLSPAFRDVFGNSFPAVAGAHVTRPLFYTDALISPREWPGIRFSLYPSNEAGHPVISLEAAYTPLEQGHDRTSRYLRLVEIRNQLQGATSDAQLALVATPLLRGTRVITTEMISWLDQIIVFEQPHGSTIAPPPLPRTFRYRCDVSPLTAPQEFAPRLLVSRLDATLLPQQSDLPKDEVLRKTIATQIAEVSAPVPLASGPSPRLLGIDDPTRKNEFRVVAGAYFTHLGKAYDAQIGFGRDQLNQHELWLLPNAVLPSPDSAKDWSFATARPLKNTLGTETLQVPNFTKSTSIEPHWHGFALEDVHFVDQDYDELARGAFRTVEQLALQAALVTDAAAIDAARVVLSSKDRIARQLAASDRLDASPYLVPLFDGAGPTLEPRALTRLGTDAFLQTLNAFYTVDTVVQLPLRQTLDQRYFTALEAKVDSPFAHAADRRPPGDPSNRLPSFSDVLLKAGEMKATILYDVPPGTFDPNNPHEVPSIPATPGAFSIRVTHVQRSAPLSAIAASPFNRGAWLELAEPLRLSWIGPGTAIPVAVRRFPAKPILEASTISPPQISPALTGSSVPLLARWGWAVHFAAEGLSSDVVDLTIRYNERDSGSFTSTRLASSSDWQPTSLLQCLIVLKQLGEHWPLVPHPKRLPMVAELLPRLADFLIELRPLLASADNPVLDRLEVAFPGGNPATVTIAESQIMQQVAIADSNVGAGIARMRRVELIANANRNTASLIVPSASGRGPVHNMRPSLRVVRNKKIGTRRLDSRLVYECATVEAPRERWALNAWTTPLSYTAAPGQTLRAALRDFFVALFGGADLELLGIEVAASLECRRGSLAMSTPFSIVPADIKSSNAEALADKVFTKIQQLLGGSGASVVPPPEVEAAALRLRVKISRASGTRPRTLVEIEAVDFQLG